ncbi:MAG: glycosyltransferase [Phycisphaerae bacterium]
MHVAVIAAGLFADTRAFLRLLASQPRVDLTLVKGDTEPAQALRAIRDAHRLWFEGAGPLLADLAGRRGADWLPGGYLRLGAGDLDRLPAAAGLWRLVRTVFVPDSVTARRVRALDPSPDTARVRVEPDGEPHDRVEWLSAKAGDLRTQDWNRVLCIAEQSHGRVRLVGNPPRELAEVLTCACGLEVVDDPAAETTVTWRCGPGLAPQFCLRKDRDDAVEVPADPPPPDPEADDTPLVSAVVPVYNGEETIDRCLVSLRRQTYPNLEIVVVDDGSTDGTAAAVAKHLNDPRVRYFDKPHSGRPDTRNRCVAEARGRYLAWLDADDEAMPNRIRAEVDAARAAGDADVVHADGLLVGPDGNVIFTRRGRSYAPEELPARFLAGVAGICPVLNTSALVRRDLYDRVGGYDAAFPRCQDVEFWCRCAAAGDVRFVHVPVPLVKVHRAAHSERTRTEALDARLRVAQRLAAGVPADALVDPLARDLRETFDVVLGRTLLATGIGMEAPADHPILAEAEVRLGRALGLANEQTRRDIAFLLNELTAYRRGGTSAEPADGLRGPPAAAHAAVGPCADPT